MLFTPLLPEAASGTLEPRHVVVPLRMMCRRAELVVGRVTALDTTRKVASVDAIDGPVEIGYERLVLALGSVSRVLPVPGLAEHGHGFRDLADAIALRNHVLRQLEAADAADTQGAGAASRVRLRRRRVRRRRGARRARRPRPGRAALLPPPESGTAALGARRRGAEDPPRDPDPARRRTRRHSSRGAASRFTSRHALESADDAGSRALRRHADRDRDARLDGGRPPQPRARGAGLPLDDRGRVPVDECLRVQGSRASGRSGDCAARAERRHARPQSTRRPRQHALRQARRLARNLPASRSPTATACSARRRRWAATRASPTCMGLRLRGFAGWFFTRTYHLYQLPLFSRKLRVVVDWTVALFFRRDIAELGSLGPSTTARGLKKPHRHEPMSPGCDSPGRSSTPCLRSRAPPPASSCRGRCSASSRTTRCSSEAGRTSPASASPPLGATAARRPDHRRRPAERRPHRPARHRLHRDGRAARHPRAGDARDHPRRTTASSASPARPRCRSAAPCSRSRRCPSLRRPRDVAPAPRRSRLRSSAAIVGLGTGGHARPVAR